MKLAVLVTLVACTAALGCTTVRAFEREVLAQPRMQLDPDPEASLVEQHVYTYREGSVGGYGGGGGGCGCN